MDRLDDILLAVSKSDEIDRGIIVTAAQKIVHSALEGLNATRASIWLIDSSINEMSCFISEPDFPISADTSHLIDSSEYKVYLEALEKQHYVVSNNATDVMQNFIDQNDDTAHTEDRSAIACAIRYKGSIIGILRCELNNYKIWSYRECSFLMNLTEMVGRGLLAQRWQSAETELFNANHHLEKKVEVRTLELTNTLDELHVVQDQLIESEKMAALGGLVAGVAHEINTPLGICITSISHLKTKADQLTKTFDSGDITEEDLTSFLRSADETLNLSQHQLQRTANLVKSFKQVAVDQSIDELSTFNLHDKLEELIISFRHELKNIHATMFIECPKNMLVTTYTGAFDLVITNLTMNSILHGLDEKQNGIIKIEVNQSDESQIDLMFSDSGCGVPEENRKKIFNPFFTTRRNKGGTGLGLNILYNLVNHKMKGTIKLATDTAQASDVGAAFLITLPAAIVE